ncbi:MAG: PAS domain S-box protein [Planctomycetes bacterium]|jgi:two-component system sensor kinase FixL|nr:PAS domain S-box protein [Planctomycetota bacterium]
MSAPLDPAPEFDHAIARRNDRLMAVAAAGAWAVAWWQHGSVLGNAALVLAGATTALALFRPWCRARTARSLQSTIWSVERQRGEALASAASHAARWQAIVDTATEGIVTIDARGSIETCNGAAERMFGYPAADVIGHNVSMLMPQPYRDEHDGYLRRYLSTGEKRIIGIGREVIGRRRDGSEFPIDLSVGEGTSVGRRFFTAVIRDITDRKEMQTKLAQTERLAAVGELAAGVAHEINNPINTVINCAQLVQDGDDAVSNCQVIIEESTRIADIVRDLLQFARDDRDRPQPTSLPEVVQRTLRLLGENWKRHGVTLQVDVPDHLPQVHARPQQIQQVLLNLLINAKDALLQGERDHRCVWLAAQVEGTGVVFTVRDNGPGIPGQLGERIFEPFVTTKRARGGTGLGLSISRSIVEGYGGTIRVDSAPGQGATFRVWLPQAPAE